MKPVVFIACHKKSEVPSDPLYLPLHVGAAGKEDIGYTRDDTGENISVKNPLYCELTGLYWCWKNLDGDHLGLSHYRRYFTLKSRSQQKKQGKLACVLSLQECEELLSKYRVIVPKKRNYYIDTVYNHYSNTFDGHQLDETRNILQERCKEYVPAFDRLMKSKKAYIFNMFIMDRELVDNYCTWLFPILEELETRIDTSKMTAFEKRYIGRVSERLFNVWLDTMISTGVIRHEEVKEIPYLYLGEVNCWKKGTSFLMAKLFHKKYEKSF